MVHTTIGGNYYGHVSDYLFAPYGYHRTVIVLTVTVTFRMDIRTVDDQTIETKLTRLSTNSAQPLF
jgi:hypothetical protein